MARIDVVVMQHELGMMPARLRECLPHSLALEKIEIEVAGKHKYFARALLGKLGDGRS